MLCDNTISHIKPSVETPNYDRASVGVGIVHLGAGAFFKTHQAVYTDKALEISGGDWGICAVSLNSTTSKETLATQDGLYTLKIMDSPARYKIIGAIKEVLAGPDERAKTILRIADTKISIVTLTITEKGYCLDADGQIDLNHAGIAADLSGEDVPKTAIGILVFGLAARKKNGAQSVTVISCDNVSGNGTKLAAAVASFATQVSLELAKWIAANVTFPNTMVDSITPAADAGLISDVRDAIGLTDNASVHREAFTDWVIEDFDGPRPDWAGAGAVFTTDVTPYEQTKLRLVNAPHSALTYLGLLSGHKTVADVMADKKLASYFFHLTETELIPSLGDSPLINLPHYRDRIGARFANKSIHHELFQIAMDGSAKLPQRFIPPLLINHQAGRKTDNVSLAIAAWMFYVLERVRSQDVLNDPLRDKILKIAKASDKTPQGDVNGLLSLTEIFPLLSGDKSRLREEIINAYNLLSDGGVSDALAQISQGGNNEN